HLQRGQPVPRCRTRRTRRRHRTRRDPRAGDEGAAHPQDEAGEHAAQEAREHPTVSRGRHVRERTSAARPAGVGPETVVAPAPDAVVEPAPEPPEPATPAPETDGPGVAAEISVRGGNPTPGEAAAVVAVVAAAVDEVRTEGELLPDAAPDAWA